MKKKRINKYHINYFGDWFIIKAYSTKQARLKLFFELGYQNLKSKTDKIKLMKDIRKNAKIQKLKY